jgi:hypothetical protein
MKKLLSLLCIVGVLPFTVGTTSAASLMRGRCDTLRGNARERCENRVIDRSQPGALDWRKQHEDLVRQRRTNTRAELQNRDRGISARRSAERMREDRQNDLRRSREDAQTSRQKRLDERKARKADQAESRGQILRNRFMGNRRIPVIDKASLRGRTRRQKERSQERRESIKQAHETCSALGVGERLECLRNERGGR